ncbi:hypothetical protein F4782DRAFT_519998 [Xylaria castorea]|nr:hypothetical protein F4782DRAFT_519998 [Xylaria castorea]
MACVFATPFLGAARFFAFPCFGLVDADAVLGPGAHVITRGGVSASEVLAVPGPSIRDSGYVRTLSSLLSFLVLVSVAVVAVSTSLATAGFFLGRGAFSFPFPFSSCRSILMPFAPPPCFDDSSNRGPTTA